MWLMTVGHVWFYVQVADPKPVEMNTMYYVKTNAPTFAPTLGAYFHAPTFI